MTSDIHPAIGITELGVSFGQRVVLDGFNLSLPADGIDVLMGPVKSGKSTLFRTLSGFFEGHPLHRSWGDVRIADRSLCQGNRPALVQQHPTLFDLSLLNALLQPSRLLSQRSAAEWRDAGLEWLSTHGLPNCVLLADQPLSQCGAVAQRSILILAQALVKPPLLMIDEPTYGLNDLDAAWMVDWLRRLSAHCKLWVCLHNQQQARRLSDRIALIGGGRVLAHQDSSQFFQRPSNEWVEQFIRTGSFALPSPGTRLQDLAEGIPVPPPLTEAARDAISAFTRQPEAAEIRQKSPKIDDPAKPVLVISVPEIAPVLERRNPAGSSNVLYTGPERRKLVEIPTASRDGVELASAVGLYKYRDSNAPRGFHWIVPGKLSGCPAPGISAPIDYDLNLLSRAGITHLITLTENDLDQTALKRHCLKNTHLPIFDREAPSVGQTHMLLVRMQKLIEAGEVLAIHCKAGLGRTGTILAAWLIREGGLTASISIERLRKIEPGYIQSQEQEEFLHRYESDLVLRLV